MVMDMMMRKTITRIYSLASEVTRSTGGRGCFGACHLAEQVPLMHLMEE